MKKSYAYPFYLIINEADQPLFSIDDGNIWLFYKEQNAFDFLKYFARCEHLFYKKRYVIKVSLTSLEEIREYITSII